MKKKILFGILFFLLVIPLLLYIGQPDFVHSLRENLYWIRSTETEPVKQIEKIIGIQPKAQVIDPEFIVEEFVVGLDRPTTMAFIGDDILVLEKNSGRVKHVKDGVLQENPVLEVEVNNKGERGLLGITTVNSSVYLYFTAAEQDGESQGNHIYMYEWNGQAAVGSIAAIIFMEATNYAFSVTAPAIVALLAAAAFAVSWNNRWAIASLVVAVFFWVDFIDKLVRRQYRTDG